MTDLTEQWKKGELTEGWYWVEYSVDEINGVAMMKYIPEFGGFSFTIIKQVLAPVPSYDEWFKIKNLASLSECLQEKNIECLHRENKLKELLKECVKMNTRLENALWQWNEESELYDENEVLENKINEVLNA